MTDRSSLASGVRLLAFGSLLLLVGLVGCDDSGGMMSGMAGHAGTSAGGRGGSSSTGRGGASGTAGVSGTTGAGGEAGTGGTSTGGAGAAGTAGGTGGDVAGSGGEGGGSGGTAGAGGDAGGGGTAGGSGGTNDGGSDATDAPPGAANGATCTDAAGCASGFCVDGVCCDTACTGTCSACTSAKTGAADGLCKPVTDGMDPDDECTQESPSTCKHDGQCDGAGACRNWAVGISCSTESCTGGTYTPARICNGAGTCLNVSTTLCGPYVCGTNTCKTSCASNAECVNGSYCSNGVCAGLKAQGATCTVGTECGSGQCVDGVCCESACSGSCTACTNAKTGAANGLCRPITAGSDPDNECAQDAASSCGLDGQCDGVGACRRWASGTNCGAATCSNGTATPARTCNGSGTCQTVTNTTCNPYVCGTAACKTTCASSTDCATGFYCNGTACVALKGQGTACTSAGECVTGSCVDGVCCETTCAGACLACANSKTALPNGLCRAVVGGTDPDNECAASAASSCGLDGMCDGVGACRRWPAGTTCGADSCSGSTYTPASTCNGAGTCQMSNPTSCGPFMCGATACAATCGSNSDCNAGYHCAAGSCVPKEQNGTACTGAGDCTSGNCVDGVCCNTDCTGTCMTCSATNSLGTCTFADPGSDPRAECVADASSTCGHDGACDGAGACRKYVAGTVCQAGSCSGGALSAASTCDGAGTCNAGTSTSCGAYKCDPAGVACLTSCATDSSCNSGFCSATACLASPSNLAGNGDAEYGTSTAGWSTHGGVALVLQNGSTTPGLSHGGMYSYADTMRTQNYEGPAYALPTGAGIYNIDLWAMQNENPNQSVAVQVNLSCGSGAGMSHFPTIGQYGFNLPQGVWTHVTGTVDLSTTADCQPTATPTAGVVRSALLYLNTVGTGTPIAYPNLFLDDIVVKVSDGHNLVGNPNFEAGVTSGWQPSGPGTLAVSNTIFRSGAAGLGVTGRTATYSGPKWTLPIGPGKYNFSLHALHNGALPHDLILQPTYTCLGGSAQFPAAIATAQQVGGNGWNALSGSYTFPPANAPAGCKLTAAGVYVQQEFGTCGTGAGQLECPDLFIDDVSITLAP